MNEAKLQEFMGKLVNDMGGAAILATVILGEELGLYRALAAVKRSLTLFAAHLALTSLPASIPKRHSDP